MEPFKGTKLEEDNNWLMEVSEPNQLRNAVEEIKHHYINQLIDAGILDDKERQSCSLTVSELKAMVKQVHHT
ncbi:hypothetical protein [Halobacillus seohaensis]|uniref:Fur-regulated basic protein FbpA n=1 Tax=Halobacillus seohaensis TaxID=447421 RepID=A0ABW2EEB4_9BACI